MVVDPATLALMISAVTPALNSAFNAVTTGSGQLADLRKTQLTLENQRGDGIGFCLQHDIKFVERSFVPPVTRQRGASRTAWGFRS